ncbi:type I-F CRISPR-associated endoribonuclease Cas6/Csy4 [Gilvimarinus algae]|uniref:Type I-F CRISPR-associated endoribonuclease Cas6/Csy4 n=1 Tax=Gilvimarinus algae TaxID=3058037 RepID=A0ABT8TI92_9GAMM|nr:type I-F CRISPR-associated endoribonuclease Cas6/Csy4 [Gilvimarinus sp. SDUM040014]MDO3383305.1 type I-F CRISPR-associated endoribonuclease Cas6/Csy4 [Gilvimarinus sp. SDUM040014]
MDHYQDISILPDPEFSLALLMGALYNKLHRALVEQKATNIGVSFPEYTVKPKSVGGVLRLHSDKPSLHRLQELGWLTGMRDHTDVSEILPVPSEKSYQCVTRRQFKTNAERLRRRRMKRKGESYDEACQAIPATVEKKPDVPYVTIRSASTGQSFCLFIDQRGVGPNSQGGEFNSYGFSQTATVPLF